MDRQKIADARDLLRFLIRHLLDQAWFWVKESPGKVTSDVSDLRMRLDMFESNVRHALSAHVEARIGALKCIPDLEPADFDRIERSVRGALSRALEREVVLAAVLDIPKFVARCHLLVKLMCIVVAGVVAYGTIGILLWVTGRIIAGLPDVGDQLLPFAFAISIVLAVLLARLTEAIGERVRIYVPLLVAVTVLVAFKLRGRVEYPNLELSPSVRRWLHSVADDALGPGYVPNQVWGTDVLWTGLVLSVPLVLYFVVLPRWVASSHVVFYRPRHGLPRSAFVTATFLDIALRLDRHLRPEVYDDRDRPKEPRENVSVARVQRYIGTESDQRYYAGRAFRGFLIDELRRHAYFIENAWARSMKVGDRVADRRVREHAYLMAAAVRRWEKDVAMGSNSRLHAMRSAFVVATVNCADGEWDLLVPPSDHVAEYRYYRLRRILVQAAVYFVVPLSLVYLILRDTISLPAEVGRPLVTALLALSAGRLLLLLDPRFGENIGTSKHLVEFLKR